MLAVRSISLRGRSEEAPTNVQWATARASIDLLDLDIAGAVAIASRGLVAGGAEALRREDFQTLPPRSGLHSRTA
jgi:hypothetical protein